MSYVLLLLVTTRLGVAAVGAFALVNVLVVLLQYLASIGLDALVMRDAATAKAERGSILGSALTLTVLLGAAAAGAMALGAPIAGGGAITTATVRAGALAVVPAACIVVAEAFLNALGRNPLVAATNTIESVVRLALAVVALWSGAGVVGVVLAFAAGRWLGLGLDVAGIVLVGRVRPALPGPAALLAFARRSLVFGANYLLQVLLLRGDLLLLSRIAGAVAFGVFYVGYRVFEMASMLPQAMVSALYPSASRLWAESGAEAARDAVERGGRLLVAASLPVCAVLWIHGRLVLALLFPGEYGGAAAPMAVLGFTLVPFGIATLGGVLLYAGGRQWLSGLALAGAGAVTVALSIALVPRLGAMGTAWTRLAWTTADAALCLLFTRRLAAPLRPLRMLGRPVLAALPAFAALVLTRDVPALSIPLAAACYLGLLWLLMRDDVRRPAAALAGEGG